MQYFLTLLALITTCAAFAQTPDPRFTVSESSDELHLQTLTPGGQGAAIKSNLDLALKQYNATLEAFAHFYQPGNNNVASAWCTSGSEELKSILFRHVDAPIDLDHYFQFPNPKDCVTIANSTGEVSFLYKAVGAKARPDYFVVKVVGWEEGAKIARDSHRKKLANEVQSMLSQGQTLNGEHLQYFVKRIIGPEAKKNPAFVDLLIETHSGAPLIFSEDEAKIINQRLIEAATR